MTNVFREFILEQLDARHWRQADLVRASGLSRSHVSKLLKDVRPRLAQLPDDTTLNGLAAAFKMDVSEVRRVATRAVGVSDDPAPTMVFGLREATDAELLSELQKRLAARLISDEEWEVQSEREKTFQIVGEIERDMQPVYTTKSENPYPRGTIEHRRFEVEREEGLAALDDLADFFADHPERGDGREIVDVTIGQGQSRTLIYEGDEVPASEGARAARLGQSVGRRRRAEQDLEGTAPDPDGPEGGA
jgi:transcriptional regulator with XRE-family HTH domain